MEKFSAFRDPGTGIQPFLAPVPPVGSDVLAYITRPIGYSLGAIRISLTIVCCLLYLILVDGVCLIFTPITPLYDLVSHAITAILARAVLFLVGLWWIPVEVVTRKRGRALKTKEKWNPSAGDIIVSNWASWVEVLWLAVRFNPVFILPICAFSQAPPSVATSSPVTRTPGRRTGTGSANIVASVSRTPTPRAPILGFRRVSLLTMLRSTGHIPGSIETMGVTASDDEPSTLEQIRKSASRPLVVFPECTTSNGRGMLRFAEVFSGINVPVKQFKVFVMSVRYDLPTAFAPTLTHSIPSSVLNPLSHIFALTCSLKPHTVSIRLLAPSESPSFGSFLASEFIPGPDEDALSEACAGLITQIGKVKRIGFGWEDKAAFLKFYRDKN